MVGTTVTAPDILAGAGATATLTFSPGPDGSASLTSTNDSQSDHDRVGVRLRAGELYRFSVNTPDSLLDTTLVLRNAIGDGAGRQRRRGFGAGPTDPLPTFRPAQTGTYYLDVGASGFRTGSCLLIA